MTKYRIIGQHGTVEASVTVSAETPEKALEDAQRYFPAYMHTQLSVSLVHDSEGDQDAT